MLTKLILIAIGGAVGTLARYGTATLLAGASERTRFPLGTLAVNVIGCLAIGLLQGMFLERWLVREEYRLAVLVGVLGGYTTFSTFGWEAHAHLRDGQFARAALIIILNNVVGIAAVMVGYALGRGRM